jgi:hypothetical protein
VETALFPQVEPSDEDGGGMRLGNGSHGVRLFRLTVRLGALRPERRSTLSVGLTSDRS